MESETGRMISVTAERPQPVTAAIARSTTGQRTLAPNGDSRSMRTAGIMAP